MASLGQRRPPYTIRLSLTLSPNSGFSRILAEGHCLRASTSTLISSGRARPAALNIPAGQWHTVKALESGSVILEMKDGAYEPLGKADVLEL